MIGFTLIFGLVVFVIILSRWLKSVAREQEESQRGRTNHGTNIPFLIFFGVLSLLSFTACNNDKPADENTTDNEKKYEVYITQEEIDKLERDEPDSTDRVYTKGEYQGMKLFMTNCNKCHPAGEKGVGPSLIDKPLPNFLIHFQVRQGLGDMPSFSKEEISNEEVKKIILFVRTLREDYKEEKDNKS
ncbi:MAG TPA: cytochrome c [Bacteroidia bacterium]|nr:cytochrome c [Bacteroidia bacterium]